MIGTRIKQIRLCKEWKQSTVAEYMDITQQAYSYLEQGISVPRIDTLIRLCSVFGIRINFLLAFDVPVTEENIEKYGTWEVGNFINEQQILEQKSTFLNNSVKGEHHFDTVESRLAVSM